MSKSKLFRYPILALIAMCLIHCSKSPDGQAIAASGSGSAPPARLEVDTEHWPVDVLGLARTTIKLVQQRGGTAFLTQIDIQLPQVNVNPPLTSVDYTFYYPKTHKRLSVTYVNTDVSMPPEQMKMAEQAGVAGVMKRVQEAVLMPQFTEMPAAKERNPPMPLPGAQISLRDAYALAHRSGLTHADHINLSVSTKDPKTPLVLWNFQGEHTQQDSQGIHIDALTGALVDEDRINDLSRAERNAQLQKALEALQALARSRSTGGLGSGQLPNAKCTTGYHVEGGRISSPFISCAPNQ